MPPKKTKKISAFNNHPQPQGCDLQSGSSNNITISLSDITEPAIIVNHSYFPTTMHNRVTAGPVLI